VFSFRFELKENLHLKYFFHKPLARVPLPAPAPPYGHSLAGLQNYRKTIYCLSIIQPARNAVSPKGATGAKPLTSSVFHILLALADEERHGLGIAEEVERRTGGAVEIAPGTLYNAIRKMLESGLIEEPANRPDPEHDDPRRRYYRITRIGRKLLEEEARRLDRVLAAVRDKAVLPERPAV
jgi:DNA-binding PadR family transcriptional regulator